MTAISQRRPLLRTRLSWLAVQVLVVASCIVVYFGVRGLTEGSVAAAERNADLVVDLERRLGIDVEAAIQAPVTTSAALQTVANWIYIWGHWPVIIGTMLWLAWRHREVFRRLRDAMILSGLAGMVVFAAFPLAPPRLVDLGLVDTVTEHSSSYRVLQPPAFVNQYAAMPSLHAGWDLLVGIAIFAAATTTWLRAVGALMPVLMAFAVVATGNHYVLDVVAGIALVLVAHGLVLLAERRRDRGRLDRAAP